VKDEGLRDSDTLMGVRFFSSEESDTGCQDVLFSFAGHRTGNRTVVMGLGEVFGYSFSLVGFRIIAPLLVLRLLTIRMAEPSTSETHLSVWIYLEMMLA